MKKSITIILTIITLNCFCQDTIPLSGIKRPIPCKLITPAKLYDYDSTFGPLSGTILIDTTKDFYIGSGNAFTSISSNVFWYENERDTIINDSFVYINHLRIQLKCMRSNSDYWSAEWYKIERQLDAAQAVLMSFNCKPFQGTNKEFLDYEKLRDEYFKLRGWDIPSKTKKQMCECPKPIKPVIKLLPIAGTTKIKPLYGRLEFKITNWKTALLSIK